MNQIYCSTGTFIGRINGRDHTLLLRYGDKIKCDGFELMLMDSWYNSLASILKDIKSANFNIPVVHCDKAIGDLLSFGTDDTLNKCLELYKMNCEAACALGAKKTVIHAWGIPKSDSDISYVCANIGKLLDIAKSYNLATVTENCCCKHGSPIENLIFLAESNDNFGMIIDTRPAQFHHELERICNEELLWKNNIRHIHINDYHGGYMEWEKLYPILHPGCGDVDFDFFFQSLKKYHYTGSITLEAPSMREDTVAYDEINRNLQFIKDRL